MLHFLLSLLIIFIITPALDSYFVKQIASTEAFISTNQKSFENFAISRFLAYSTDCTKFCNYNIIITGFQFKYLLLLSFHYDLKKLNISAQRYCNSFIGVTVGFCYRNFFKNFQKLQFECSVHKAFDFFVIPMLHFLKELILTYYKLLYSHYISEFKVPLNLVVIFQSWFNISQTIFDTIINCRNPILKTSKPLIHNTLKIITI
ncbi:hypothetical protein AT05_02105 [Schleiferia thermophila str. Yellowstone]|jgi:hypothetical protein|nr:hypothetical protein AT05_02105 [Schleiferia thermophila str. Yellowstone]